MALVDAGSSGVVEVGVGGKGVDIGTDWERRAAWRGRSERQRSK